MTRLTTILALAALTAPALADDLTPPPWRFSPGTTVQHWDFSAGPAGGAPDAGPFFNPHGIPMLSTAGAPVWLPFFNGRNDVWDSSQGALILDIPNTGNTANQKELWLQTTYFALAPVISPNYSVLTGAGTPFAFLGSTITPLPGGWVHELTRWHTPVCPPLEHITIAPLGTPLFVDQIVVDTRCYPIPSPASASLLACAGLLALRRRR